MGDAFFLPRDRQGPVLLEQHSGQSADLEFLRSFNLTQPAVFGIASTIRRQALAERTGVLVRNLRVLERVQDESAAVGQLERLADDRIESDLDGASAEADVLDAGVSHVDAFSGAR